MKIKRNDVVDKQMINDAVDKVMEDYGDVIRRLGNEPAKDEIERLCGVLNEIIRLKTWRFTLEKQRQIGLGWRGIYFLADGGIGTPYST